MNPASENAPTGAASSSAVPRPAGRAPDDPDAALAVRAQQGDRGAAGVLVERHQPAVARLEGWGLAQIAAQFGWTLTATKLRAWRARRQLRTLLQARDLP